MLTDTQQHKKAAHLFIERLASIGTFLGATILVWFVLYLMGCYIELLGLLGSAW